MATTRLHYELGQSYQELVVSWSELWEGIDEDLRRELRMKAVPIGALLAKDVLHVNSEKGVIVDFGGTIKIGKTSHIITVGETAASQPLRTRNPTSPSAVEGAIDKVSEGHRLPNKVLTPCQTDGSHLLFRP